MAHWAKVIDGVVIDMLVADQSFIDSYDDGRPGKWIQTSYNTRGNRHYDPVTLADDSDINPPLRGNYAGIGYSYDEINDVFYPKQPYESWHISEDTNWLWQPPTAMPKDGQPYQWDEDSRSWLALPREAG
jgi:hypothetical protein